MLRLSGGWFSQVLWWSTLSDKFQEELAAQSQVFGGEHSQQRHKDFRSAASPSLPLHPCSVSQQTDYATFALLALPRSLHRRVELGSASARGAPYNSHARQRGGYPGTQTPHGPEC